MLGRSFGDLQGNSFCKFIKPLNYSGSVSTHNILSHGVSEVHSMCGKILPFVYVEPGFYCVNLMPLSPFEGRRNEYLISHVT